MYWSYSLQRWVKNLISRKFASKLLEVLGVFLVIIEVAKLIHPPASKSMQENSLLFVTVCVAFALVRCRPKSKVNARLNGRDVHLEVVIDNIFSFPGALIVGTNTTFDTKISNQLISPESVQGQFTKEHYADEQQLDREVESQLEVIQPQVELDGNRIGKTRRYEIGQVVQLTTKEKNAYLIAIAHINEHGNAQGSFEYVKEALAKLWIFIGERSYTQIWCMG